MQKWKVYLVLAVYALVSLTPTIYFHGCCCGTEQSWFVPIEDCCDEHEHGHTAEIEADCCQEDALFLVVDDQPTLDFLRIHFPPAVIVQLSGDLLFAGDVIDDSTKGYHIDVPPLIRERTILFSQLIFYDVVS